MKLLVCDVEGTIFKAKYRIEGTNYASTMWQPIAHVLGEAALIEEAETHTKWSNSGYESYISWVEDTIEIHKKYGLHESAFNKLINDASYMDGVIDFFSNLDRTKYIPVFISGGFQELIRRAQRELCVNYGFGACEYIFDENDGMLAGYSLKPCDFEGKYNSIKHLFREFNLNSQEDWVFIGDGLNDVSIAKKAPVSFGVAAHKDLSDVVTYRVECFSQIERILHGLEIESCDDTNNVENQSIKSSHKGDKQKQNDKRGKGEKKLRINENEHLVRECDYTSIPIKPLNDFLDEHKVLFFGLEKDTETFKTLSALHENMDVISGVKDNFNSSKMKNYDFIFIYKDYMSHTAFWKSEKALSHVPFAKLKHHKNMDLLVNVMANLLQRALS